MENNKYRERLLKLLNKKEVYSCFSNELVEFVDDVYGIIDKIGDDKVVCDLTFLIDGAANVESGIEKIYFKLKNHCKCKHYYNFYDFSYENGIFDNNCDVEAFLKRIEEIMEDRFDYFEKENGNR